MFHHFVSPSVNLWQVDPVENPDGSTTFGARIEIGGVEPSSISFKVPMQHIDAVTDSFDPFVVASIFAIAPTGGQVKAHGQVSPSLLRNLIDFFNTWRAWCPDKFAFSEISADSELEDEPGSNESICAFSCDLHSLYSVYRQKTEPTERRNRKVAACLLVNGHQIPVAEKSHFETLISRTKDLLEGVDTEVIHIESSFRNLGGDWKLTHGAATAAALMLFKKRFSLGLIPSVYGYNRLLLPYGSNPITDPFLSSKSFEISHDAPHCSISQKLAALRSFRQVYDSLSVCSVTGPDANCGECIDCVATWLYATVNNFAPPASIPEPLPEKIALLKKDELPAWFGLQSLADTLKESAKQTASEFEVPTPVVTAFRRLFEDSKTTTTFSSKVKSAIDFRIKELDDRFKERVPYLDLAGGPENVIFLAGSPRSGTTWVGSVLAKTSRGRMLFEPLLLDKSLNLVHARDDWFNFTRFKRIELTCTRNYQLYIPPDADSPYFDAIERILKGRVRGWPVDIETKWGVYRRRVIKEVLANLYLGYLHKNWPLMRIVVITRNPLSVINSQLGRIAKSRWIFDWDAEHVLKQGALMERLGDFARAVKPAGSLPERLAHKWCIETLVPRLEMDESSAFFLHYDALAAQPEMWKDVLAFCRLSMPNSSEFKELIAAPSSTAARDKNSIRDRIEIYKYLSTDDVTAVKKVVESYGLSGWLQN